MWLSTLAMASPMWDRMEEESGWSPLAMVSSEDTGELRVSQRMIAGTRCLRGQMRVDADPDLLYAVVSDIATEPSWSSETLSESEILGSRSGGIDYYQHLSVPRWTMAADRYWVLHGTDTSGPSVREFRWESFDWESRYPALRERIDRDHAGAVEPTENYGYWRFEHRPTGVIATYAICTSAGGAIPDWVQRKAASRALPGTMIDVVREAGRRAYLL